MSRDTCRLVNHDYHELTTGAHGGGVRNYIIVFLDDKKSSEFIAVASKYNTNNNLIIANMFYANVMASNV